MSHSDQSPSVKNPDWKAIRLWILVPFCRVKFTVWGAASVLPTTSFTYFLSLTHSGHLTLLPESPLSPPLYLITLHQCAASALTTQLLTKQMTNQSAIHSHNHASKQKELQWTAWLKKIHFHLNETEVWVQALCSSSKVFTGHGSMKQMKQVYNYSRTETWTPEPEVSFRESLFCINLCPSQKRESWGLISYSENIVWLSNHTAFLNFGICNGHPGTRRVEEEFLCFHLITFSMVFEFQLILLEMPQNAFPSLHGLRFTQVKLEWTRTHTYSKPFSGIMQNTGSHGTNTACGEILGQNYYN